MTEVFTDISPEIKQIAETSWKIAIGQNNPMDGAKFLDNIVRYYKALNYSEKDIDFLQFYFKMQMEMIKNDNADPER